MKRKTGFNYVTGGFIALIVAGCMDVGSRGEDLGTADGRLIAPPSTCPDSDYDGICDIHDNCPDAHNPDQYDGDRDGYGDACDCLDVDYDNVCDVDDNCPDAHNPDQYDADDDGYGDACDCRDKDIDGICDEDDLCLGTFIPEKYVPSEELWYNRFALMDGDHLFDTGGMKGQPLPRIYTLEDTRGCSCEQIIEALDLGQGQIKNGCSITAMDFWISKVNK